MRTRLLSLLLSLAFAIHASAFVEPMEFGAKCVGADVIVRGVVVDMVRLVKDVDDSRGVSSEPITDHDFPGPNAVAIVRITELLKGKPESFKGNGIIFVPCGYNFDESPAELTKSKEYVLFLQAMGHNYLHPTSAFSTHRIQLGKVGTSGFDSDSDFKADAEPGSSVEYAAFAKQVRDALEAGKK